MKSSRAKLFRNGGSQAVRLPLACRFPEDAGEVLVRQDGRRVILEAVDEWREDVRERPGRPEDDEDIGQPTEGVPEDRNDLERQERDGQREEDADELPLSRADLHALNRTRACPGRGRTIRPCLSR